MKPQKLQMVISQTQSLYKAYTLFKVCECNCRMDIENTRWVSFDTKFTRQGFENAYWYREAILVFY